MKIQTSPFLTLTKIPENEIWLCGFINSPTFFRVNNLVAGIIVLGMEKEWDFEEFISEIINLSESASEKIISLLNDLIIKKIMIENKDENSTFLNEFNIYQDYGWKSAAEYHFSSVDYPFIDYHTLSGYDEDEKRMQAFFSQEKEVPRFKTYEVESSIPCPHPSEISFDRKYHDTIHLHDMQDIICFSLGKVRYGKKITKDGSPLIHKVVPSGGGKHPTEAYIIVLNVVGINNGIYHFNSGMNSLDALKAEVSKDKITEAFYSIESFLGFTPKVIVVLTSLFERNMFRYREPRTFRAIHMDVGHILKVVETIVRIKDIKFQIQYNTNENKLEELLNLEPFNEGIMASFAIG